MRNSKLGLRAFALAILGALSLMAFFAAGAQAAELSPKLATELTHLGQFKIGGGAALLAGLIGEQEGVGTLRVEKSGLELQCKTGSVTGGKLNTATDASATSVLFAECVVLDLNLKPLADCTVLSQKGEEKSGSVKTNPLLALPYLHYPEEGLKGTPKLFVVFEPAGATPLVTLEFHLPECPLMLEMPVSGYVAAEVTTNEVVEPLLTFSKAVSELVGKGRLFASVNAAVLEGSFKVRLNGAPHTGLKLGVV